MGKIRVHDLAKKLNLTNQELMTKLAAKGIVVKTHSSSIDEAQAMTAIQVGAEGASGGGAAKPRTVLRRRAETPAEELLPPAPEETVQEAAPPPQALKVEEEIEVTQAEPVMVSHEPEQAEESVEAASKPEPEAKPEPVEAPVRPPATAYIQGTSPIRPAGSRVIVPSNNVVRVIDADAIKARLAAEGRSFRPKVTPRPPGTTLGLIRPSYSGVREIKVVHGPGGMPQMLDVTGQKTGPGARPGKRKDKDGPPFGNDRREGGKGGGSELWMQPGKKRKGQKRDDRGPTLTQAAAHKRVVELSGPITVNDLAHQMSVKAGQVIQKLMGMGMMVTVNQPIDFDTAAIVAAEFEYEVKNVAFEEKALLKREEDTPESLKFRPPVVTVMGHVDHGKTSVLDAIRKAEVAAGEAGGITQHIGAYTVETDRGTVTFLDTPGHEAFTAMRARGAQVTDIVVLVVAADDGVMPQTLEAIDHAKAAKVPVVVAINKIDAPNAKPERVMQQLSEHGIIGEEWGGDVQMFKVSALKKLGLKELLDGLITQAEMMELKANPDKQAVGTVIEAKLDKGRGPVATVLTRSGTLRVGDILVAGEHTGRVRAMLDSNGNRLTESLPSMAVQVLGLSGVPMAGDVFNVVSDDKAAKTIAENRAQKAREQELMKFSRVTLENFLQSSPDNKVHDLRLIVKADVFGSVEALVAALKGLSTRQVNVDVVHSGVGTITENDVNLALASKAIIIGFNTKPDTKAQSLASSEKVDVRAYSVIYTMLDEIRLAMAGMLAPVIEENYLGKAEVRMVIGVTKFGKIAGCYVLDGKIVRSARVRVQRGKESVFEGNIASLKRFKDDVREVTAGYECGLGIAGFDDLKEFDVIECFEAKHVAAKLDESLKDEAKRKKTQEPEAAQSAQA